MKGVPIQTRVARLKAIITKSMGVMTLRGEANTDFMQRAYDLDDLIEKHDKILALKRRGQPKITSLFLPYSPTRREIQ